MSQTIARASCPGCHREIALRPSSGTFRTHGPIGDRCPGSWRTPYDEVVQHNQPPLTDRLRRCWQIGDAFAASQLTGIVYRTPAIPAGLDLDQELAFVIADARTFVTDVYRTLTT